MYKNFRKRMIADAILTLFLIGMLVWAWLDFKDLATSIVLTFLILCLAFMIWCADISGYKYIRKTRRK